MAKYLDLTGLTTFWTKVKSWVAAAVTTNGPSTSKTVTGWNEGKMTFGNIQISESQVTNLQTHLNAKAPLASPGLTGTPTAPTAATGTNTTQIATTAYVRAEIQSMIKDMDAVVFKNTIDGGSTGAYGALTPAADKGDLYIVSTAGKIDGVAVEPGDWLICKVDGTAAATANNYSTVVENWGFIQVNKDGIVIGPSSATSGNVVVFDGTTGKLIKDSGKTLGKSVPSDAAFTDTKVTAVGNHYTPSADSSAELSAAASGATAAWSIDVVKAVQLQRDAKGHVVGVSVTSGKLPANPNSDTKVTQNSNSEDKEFPLLAKFTNNTTNETNTSKYAAGVTVNPSKKQISATKFKGALEGNADTASAAASGSALETAIDAKASKVASATEGNFAALDANGNLVDSGHKHADYKTKQTAKTDPTASGTSVTFIDTFAQNANGETTVTKKTVRTMGAATSSAAGTTGLVPAPGSGKQGSFLRGDGTWVVPTDTKNTAGSTDSSSKLFLIGATSQGANPQTYSHDTAFVGTDGCLYSNSQKVLTETVASNTYEPKMTPITDEEINALT